MIKIKIKGIVLVVVVLFSIELKSQNYVPNEETALKIAEYIWLSIYGDGIYGFTPFKAKTKNDTIWVVSGTLKKDTCGNKKGILKIATGGVPYIEIRKSDCKILKVKHGK